MRWVHSPQTMYPKSAHCYTNMRVGGSSFLYILVVLSLSTLLVARTAALQDFDWDTISPSAHLKWQKCYLRFECARFSVPFDYSDPDGEKFAIAMVRLPSKLAPSDGNYRGPILFNPGGPGASGIDLVLEIAHGYQALIGDEFDYVGFDPRGVGHTTPRVNIFPSASDFLLMQAEGPISMNTSTESLGRLFGQNQITSALSEMHPKRNYFEHLSTPEVATDMLSIVKAYGMEKLQFYGFSYGSVLGVTFATMFPDHIARLVVDGVIDAEDYYATLWENTLVDSDLSLSLFYQDCVDVGPDLCAIYEPTVGQIRERVNAVLERLKIEPHAFVNATDGSHGVVDYDIVKSRLFSVASGPHIYGKSSAEMIAALEAGNPWPIWSTSLKAVAQRLLRDTCSTNDNVNNLQLSTIPIVCSDGAPTNDTLTDLRDYYSRMSAQSSFADMMYTRTSCAPWKIPAKYRFQGKFTANTSHPILFIGNTADSLTPLRNARKMASGFSGAVVLQQDGPGHVSIASLSVCTFGAVRDYFRNGTLPKPNTVCAVQSSSFLDPQDRGVTDDESRLFKIAEEIFYSARRFLAQDL